MPDLTKQVLEEFRNYLEELKLGGPTVHKQFKNPRIFLNWIAAHDESDEIRIPSAYKKFKVKARYGDPIGLTSEQFFQFYKLDLSNRKYLERTRDVFAFAVYIGGPRHGDLKRLADNLRKNGFRIDKNMIIQEPIYSVPSCAYHTSAPISPLRRGIRSSHVRANGAISGHGSKLMM